MLCLGHVGKLQVSVIHLHEALPTYQLANIHSATAGLPQLSDAQALKLRFLSLLTIASEKASSSNLSYASLCSRLDLESPIDLEHLITQAIYNDLVTGTLNPASQTVIITSVAPLRDPAPGSVQAMIAELNAWSGRCDTVLSNLEEKITKVKSDAEKRARREQKADKQIKAVTEEGGKGAAVSSGGTLAPSKLGLNTRGATKREQADDDDDEDMMDLDEPSRNAGGGRKKSSGSQGMLGRFKR